MHELSPEVHTRCRRPAKALPALPAGALADLPYTAPLYDTQHKVLYCIVLDLLAQLRIT